jgi:hypothetical protein
LNKAQTGTERGFLEERVFKPKRKAERKEEFLLAGLTVKVFIYY